MNKAQRKIRKFSKLLIISSFLSLISVSPVVTQEELLQTLLVTGDGVEKIANTLAEVNLGVEIRGKTASQVQKEIARRTSNVVELLRSKDIEQLQTTGVRLNPEYRRSDEINNNQRILIGYVGTNTVSFVLPTEEVGTLLDETVEAGASRIDGISFTAAPEAISTAKKEALRKATTDAQAKANVVLETLNLASQEIVNIRIDDAGVSQPRVISNAQFSRAAEDFSTTPIISGEQAVRASVTLQISY